MRSYSVDAWAVAVLSIAVLTAAPIVATSQSNGSSSKGQLSAEELGSISGKVTDLQSGAPVAGGWVLASSRQTPMQRYGGRIQSDGTYRIYRLEPGTYTLRVEAGGYVPGTHNPGETNPKAMGGAVGVTVTAGKVSDGINVELQKEATISGRVVDENGFPVARTQVSANVQMLVNNQARWVPRVTVPADANGEYRLAGLPPGEYVISAQNMLQTNMGNVVDRSDPHVDRPLPTYPQTFHPGVTEQSHATRVAISAADQKFGIDIQLFPVSGYSVSGVVLMPDGSPATECSLVIRGKSDSGFNLMGQSHFSRTNPRDGTFRLSGLAEGVYTMQGGVTSGSAKLFLNDQLVIAGEDVNDLRLVLRPGTSVKGTLVFEGEVANRPEKTPSRSMIAIEPIDRASGTSFSSPGFQFRTNRNAPADDVGAFRFEDLPPGEYRIRARLANGFYLSTVFLGGQDVTAEGIDLSQSSGEVTVRLVVKADAGVIEGMAQGESGDARMGATIRLFPTGKHANREDFVRGAVSGQTGSFRLESVPPGDYMLVAVEAGSLRPEVVAAALEQWKAKGEKITVQPNGHQQVTVKVQKPRPGM